MRQRILVWLNQNSKTIVLTFEIFWILVFLLDRVSGSHSADIPQFIYVNF
jgi:hypothetical protein